MINIPSSVIPAPIQYVVSLLTLPLLRSRTLPMGSVTHLRRTMSRKLWVKVTSAPFTKDRFEIQVSVHESSSGQVTSFYSVCEECGVEWSKVERYLGNTVNLSFTLTPSAVVAQPSRIPLWQAEKPSLPSYGLGLLKIKEKSDAQIVVEDVPPTPYLKPLVISGDVISPLTPKNTCQLMAVLVPPPSPIESELSSSEDESSLFSDVASSTAESSDEEEVEPQSSRTTTPRKWQRRKASITKPDLHLSVEAQAFKYADGETLVLSGSVKLGMPSTAFRHPDMHVDEDEWSCVVVDDLVADSQPTPKPKAAFSREVTVPKRAMRSVSQNSRQRPQKKTNRTHAANGFNFPMKGSNGVSEKAGNWRTVRNDLTVKV